MKQTINFYDFQRAFNDMGRENQFSYDGLKALFDMLEEIDPDYKLDVIGLCCDYTEATPIEIADMYNIELTNDKDIDEDMVSDFLTGRGVLIGFISSGSILFQNF